MTEQNPTDAAVNRDRPANQPTTAPTPRRVTRAAPRTTTRTVSSAATGNALPRLAAEPQSKPATRTTRRVSSRTSTATTTDRAAAATPKPRATRARTTGISANGATPDTAIAPTQPDVPPIEAALGMPVAVPPAPHVGADQPAPSIMTPTTLPRRGGISPENTVFVSLSFEGPDVYSTAGGLGTRVTEFTETLARLGYETHLIFVGDPTQPATEDRVAGRLHLHRWGQWISHYHPSGVYDGEEWKLNDYNATVPRFVCDHIARPAVEEGKIVVIIGEDWHTAEAISRTSDLLHWNNLRHRCILMWNCNSLMSLHRINWGRLAFTATITTVSRYMKHRLWDYGVNALVVPNGIPRRYLDPVSQEAIQELREVAKRGDPNRLFLFKIGRFDPDKRWLMAMEAAARLKHSGHPLTMIIRGGIEPHGSEVLALAHRLGLTVRDIDARRPATEEGVRLLREAAEADVYNLRYFVPEALVRRMYAAADAVLANSGHEPFGLVGLEVMAARGIAFTGSTGEDYALSFENAVALETDDPEEIVGYLLHLLRHPEEQAKIRAAGWQTASEFTWEEAIDNLSGKLGYLARKQSIVLA